MSFWVLNGVLDLDDSVLGGPLGMLGLILCCFLRLFDRIRMDSSRIRLHFKRMQIACTTVSQVTPKKIRTIYSQICILVSCVMFSALEGI